MPALIGKKCECGKLAVAKLTKYWKRGGGNAIKHFCKGCASVLSYQAVISRNYTAKLERIIPRIWAEDNKVVKLVSQKPVPPLVIIPERKRCKACEGSGLASKGGECWPCNGTGVQRDNTITLTDAGWKEHREVLKQQAEQSKPHSLFD